MSKISYEEIGAVVATFTVEGAVGEGAVVAVKANDTVAPCADGDKFCGVARTPRGGSTAVQVRGFVGVRYTGSLNAGWATLVANGQGGVKSAGTGRELLVVSTDGNGLAVVCL